MRSLILLPCIFMLLVVQRVSADTVLTAESPDNRVALLELYTSQGCSSCPPAERWLSSLKDSGISSEQIIPLAFHVTYWDYIGWRDRFGSHQYDERQRRIAAYNKQRSIYTPQFVLAGDDFRSYATFSGDVRAIVSMPASIDLKLMVQDNQPGFIDVMLSASADENDLSEVPLYLVLYENDLQSKVEDGENEGKLLQHDYVVRQLYGPFQYSLSTSRAPIQQLVAMDKNWKTHDLHLVAFAQHPATGEILQAVQLELGQLD